MLYPHQRTLIDEVQRTFAQGAESVMMQGPCGFGKTHTVAEGIIVPSLAYGRRFVFAAHLEELLDDTRARLAAYGLRVGVVKSGRPSDPDAPVQVASTPTLARMLERGAALPHADRLILDEAHRGSSRGNRAIIQHYRQRGARVLGLSASPARGDDQALDEFQAMVLGPSVKSLIAGGFLVAPRLFAPKMALQRGVAENPVTVVTQQCVGRRCMVFAPDAKSAAQIAANIPNAETIVENTPPAVRATVRDRLASGETQHVVTVRALLEGFDAPVIDTVILCAAFTTIVPYIQGCGRGMRAYRNPVTGEPKRNCIIHDLRGAVHLHGLPDDDRRWSLDGVQGTSDTSIARRRCADCHAIFPPSSRCPNCGSRHTVDTRPMRIQRTEMFEASNISPMDRVGMWLDGAVRAIQRRKPNVSVEWARATVMRKPPSWVREAIEREHERMLAEGDGGQEKQA